MEQLVATPDITPQATTLATPQATLAILHTLGGTLQDMGIQVAMLEAIPTLRDTLAILCTHQAILATLADMDILVNNCLAM